MERIDTDGEPVFEAGVGAGAAKRQECRFSWRTESGVAENGIIVARDPFEFDV